jgi:hypothetical protein
MVGVTFVGPVGVLGTALGAGAGCPDPNSRNSLACARSKPWKNASVAASS